MSRIGRTAKGGSQSISVGTTPLIAANILPQAIREFRSQRPDLRIQLFDADLTTLMHRLEAGKLDMALGMYWFKNVPGFRRTPLFRFSLVVIRADKIGAPHRASMTWSALNGQTLISMPPTVPHQNHRQVFSENRCCLPTRCPRQFTGYADRVGRGRRRHCRHPLIWTAGLPQSKSRDKPVDQSHRELGVPSD
jgi:DNA-binding transcriptional LysR family regulator